MQALVDLKGAIESIFGIIGTLVESIERSRSAILRIRDDQQARQQFDRLKHLLTLYGNLYMRQSGPVPLGQQMINYARSPSEEQWSWIIQRFSQVDDIAASAIEFLQTNMDSFIGVAEYPSLATAANARLALSHHVRRLERPVNPEELVVCDQIGREYLRQTAKLEELVRDLAREIGRPSLDV
jgi:hypothetical protein